MYRQFDSSSDKPKSAARLLAEAAFAPPSASRHPADTTAPVVKIVNRRFTLQRNYRLASNDGQPGPTPAAANPADCPQGEQAQQAQQQHQQQPVAAKTARVFLVPAPLVEAGSASAAETSVAEPAAASQAMPAGFESPAPPLPPQSPADALTALFADPGDAPAEPQYRRDSKLWRKSRRANPHGPVRVIYSAPPVVLANPQMQAETANADAALQEPQQLESILLLQQQMADVDALLADIQFAENFSIDVDRASSAAALKDLLAELDHLAAQFPSRD